MLSVLDERGRLNVEREAEDLFIAKPQQVTLIGEIWSGAVKRWNILADLLELMMQMFGKWMDHAYRIFISSARTSSV